MHDDRDRGEKESAWEQIAVGLTPVLAALAVVTVGLVLIHHQSDWLIAALAVAVAIIASTVVAVGVSQLYMRRTVKIVQKIEHVVAKRITEVGRAALIHSEARDGITQAGLSKFEEETDLETVWLVGSNYDNEIARDSPFPSVVKRNIEERGVRYVYITPKDLEQKFTRLRRFLGISAADPRLKTYFLTSQQWLHIPYNAGNFVIYDPLREGRAPKGYCWDPGGDGKSFIQVRDKVDDWIDGLQTLVPELAEPDGEEPPHDG